MPLNITTPDGGSASVGIPSEGQTMRLAIGSGMVDAALVAKDFYNAANLNPEYVADFFESYYRVNKVPSTFSGALNFARTGPATKTDATGTLQTAADGVPRKDHHIWDGSAWVNQGLLLESDAATNLLTYSEQFDNAAWTKQQTAVTSNATNSPSGTATAEKLIPSTTDTPQHAALQTVTVVSGNVYTVSCYFKAGEYTGAYIRDGFSGRHVVFNLSTGAITATSSATGTITEVSDGWFRCTASMTSVGTSFRVDIGVLQNGSQAVATSYTGDGTSGIFIWGAQLETGSIATSYIKTEATTATRNAETLTASAGDLPYNLTAVSIQMEGTVNGTPSTLIDWQADASNLITLSAGASDFTFTQEQAGTVDSVTGGSYTPGINVPFNIASRHGSTFLNGAVDGTALTANTTPTALPDLTATDLDIAPNFNGTIKRLRIWGSDIGDTGIAQASD